MEVQDAFQCIAKPKMALTLGVLLAGWPLSVLLPISVAVSFYRHTTGESPYVMGAVGSLFLLCLIPFLLALSFSMIRGRGLIYIEDAAIIVFSDSYYSMPISAVRSFAVENEGKCLVIRSAETVQKIPAYLVEGPVGAAVERWDAWNRKLSSLSAYGQMSSAAE